MSQWTHVAAVFRVDSFRSLCEQVDFHDIMGRECTFEELYLGDSEEQRALCIEYADHPERFLPGGSEGTLEMSVWENPDSHCVAAYTVSVFGDLRDFGEKERDSILFPWFERCCGSMWVRQAFIQADVEFSDVKCAVWDCEEGRAVYLP